jgi:tetratricopeptide (TPR) repeat protein
LGGYKEIAVIGPLKRIVIVVFTVSLLGGCSLFQSDLFTESFWAGSPLRVNDEAELGVAELAKGNYVTAEAHFRKALKSNPRDIDALIGAGILYQNTGQLTKARQMYEAVLALRPDDSYQFVVWNDITTRPASQIASVNLSLLESGGTMQGNTASMPAAGLQNSPRQMARTDTGVTVPGTPAPGVPVTGAPSTSAMLGRTATMPSGASGSMNDTGAPIGSFAGADSNIISRFSTLRALRDQGLITQQEYARRRQTNIGALMPLTSPPPAAGLDRPVPTSEQISGRLRAIGRALEMRAISVSQHAAERSMILDALMPSAPVVVANPGVPPKGLMEAADSVRRLEQLKNSGYISSDEYARERQAIELSMRPAAPAMASTGGAPAASPAGQVKMLDKSKAAKMSGPQPAIHLASYRSKKQAERGWAQIRRAHGGLIGKLDHAVVKVKLGKKGTYYRLKAGPMPDANAAKDMCRKLKRRRQYCEPSTMVAG